MKKSCVVLMLIVLTNLSIVEGKTLTLSTIKSVYIPGDTIIVEAEVYNEHEYPIQVTLESFLKNKGETYVTMPMHYSLELESSEKSKILLHNITVDSEFYSDEYIVSTRLLMDQNIIETGELSFFVKDTLNEMKFEVYSCKDQSCSKKSKIFIKNERIYLDYESDVSDLTITSVLIYPDGTEQEIELPTSFKFEKVGTYEIEIAASKQGYRTVEKKVQFGIVEKYIVIDGEKPRVQMMWIITGLCVVSLIVVIIFIRRRKSKPSWRDLYQKWR